MGLAHGETSTGVLTNIDPFRKVADELEALLIVDAVATLVGVPLNVDNQRIDICFSGSQKALSAPPGMSPITVNSRVEDVLRKRKTPVQSWYFDLTTVKNYWGKERTYHHTPPIPLIYALYEALRLTLEEGLKERWERHRQNQMALIAGLEGMGMNLFVRKPADRLPTSVTAVEIPNGVDGARVRSRLLNEFHIEISGGLGELKSKILRGGFMRMLDRLPTRQSAAISRCAGKNPAGRGNETPGRRGGGGRCGQFRARRTRGSSRPQKVAR